MGQLLNPGEQFGNVYKIEKQTSDQSNEYSWLLLFNNPIFKIFRLEGFFIKDKRKFD